MVAIQSDVSFIEHCLVKLKQRVILTQEENKILVDEVHKLHTVCMNSTHSKTELLLKCTPVTLNFCKCTCYNKNYLTVLLSVYKELL